MLEQFTKTNLMLSEVKTDFKFAQNSICVTWHWQIVPVYFTTERIGIAIDFEVYDFAQSIPASVFPGLAL